MGGRGRAGLPEGPGGSAKAGQREEVWKRGDAGSEGPGGSAEAGQREEVRKRGDAGSEDPGGDAGARTERRGAEARGYGVGWSPAGAQERGQRQNGR
ncbi:hypothetical protein B5G16_02735 [Alistipes sp. An66]|nr:hypothetical protein B5G16_02735 [Alistipes sp. An66]